MRLVLATMTTAMMLLGIMAVPAGAAEVEVDAPAEVTVGENTRVTAAVTLENEPVVGGELALAFLGRIGGESGWVVVDTGTTDEGGMVTFEYPQRALGGERMRVEYFGPDGQENTEFTVVVNDGPQLHSSSAGADLPILGVWWLVVVLAIVWVSLIVAVFRLGQLGRESDHETGPAKTIPGIMLSFVALTALGMFVVVLTRPTAHANLDPTADFSRVPTGVVGVETDYTGLSDSGPGRGLDGQELFIQAGCASCHGLQGLGALVGESISGEDHAVRSVGALLEEVREGPKGMPAFSESLLTDDDVAEIFAYLDAFSDQ